VVNPIKLDAAVHVGKMNRTTQQGDTLIHNPAAYQVMQGADSETLLSKMAGIVVSDTGVEAGGRDVARILLDGQEFFGNDVLTALRTIPADLVKQVEVINKLSDDAQMTGVDDGEGYTAINIVTKRRKGNGVLSGRLYGSYGLPEDCQRHNYIAGGNISRFAEKKTLNVIGMSNNISKFNFTTSDILSGVSGLNEGASKDFKVKALAGISEVHSLGANYSDKNNNFSYFFSYIDNENSPESERNQMTSQEDRLQNIMRRTLSDATNMTHKFSGKMTFNPSKRHSFIFRPDFSVEKLGEGSTQYSTYRYHYTDADPMFIRNQLNEISSHRWVFRAQSTLNYRYSFKSKRRRSLSAYARYSYYGSRIDYNSWQYYFRDENTDYNVEDSYNTYIQRRDNNADVHSGALTVTFTEPLTKRSTFSAQYTSVLNSTNTDNLVGVLNNKSDQYEQSDRLSGVSTATFLQNRAGGRYSYGFKKMNLVLGASYQHTSFFGNVTLPMEGNTVRDYHHFLYQISANLPFNKSHTLKIEAKSRTSNPANSLLQNIVNLSSTSNIRAGNPNLTPAYLHEGEVRYTFTDSKSGSTLSFLTNFTASPDYFCDSLVINTPGFQVMEGVTLGENDQFVKPINLKGYYKLYTRLGYTIPITLIRCNFNVNATASLKQMPSMVNGDFVPVKTHWYQLGGRLTSNISKNLDFMLAYEARYSMNQYNGKFGLRQNNYYFHRVSGKLKWIFLDGFTFTGAAQYRRFVSTAGLYDDNMVLCDLFVGRKLLKSKMLEVSAGVNDLFNHNTKHYWHSVNASGTNDGFNVGLGRYFSVQCIWHIRNGYQK
jgi:hypothetical protein